MDGAQGGVNLNVQQRWERGRGDVPECNRD